MWQKGNVQCIVKYRVKIRLNLQSVNLIPQRWKLRPAASFIRYNQRHRRKTIVWWVCPSPGQAISFFILFYWVMFAPFCRGRVIDSRWRGGNPWFQAGQKVTPESFPPDSERVLRMPRYPSASYCRIIHSRACYRGIKSKKRPRAIIIVCTVDREQSNGGSSVRGILVHVFTLLIHSGSSFGLWLVAVRFRGYRRAISKPFTSYSRQNFLRAFPVFFQLSCFFVFLFNRRN